MKKLMTVWLLVFCSVLSFGQFNSLKQDEGMLAGGFGMTWIDDNPYYAFHLRPEFAFSNIGVGLDLNLEFDSNGKLRKENFNEFSDYMSVIRYIRYGQKKDPVYARLGALDYATLGHGSIMYMYNNSPSFDARRIGLEFDVDFNQFGFETVYGSFAQAGVLGLRGYVRPLQFSDLGKIPVIGNLEVGLSFVADVNEYAGVTAGAIDPTSGKFKSSNDEGATTVFGFDLSLPIVKGKIANLDVYFDYASIGGFGSGTATGAILSFNGLGAVDIRTKFERRFNGDEYLPSYFNAMYEIERFKFDGNSGTVSSKIQQLKGLKSVGNGFYGELLVRLLGSFDIIGSYQRLDDHPNSGILHLEADVSPKGMSYVARAGYDKVNIEDEKDLFTLDDRSYLFAELGYKPMPYIIVSMVYNWTFTPIRDADDNVIKYSPQKKIEPRVSFVYPINL